ncbi:hypothetical protein BP5796_03969 [Coleophoma crateriformis]|uniref:Smr domain-containing protein n=1 Tax=Coleophoma crateriformis TaxID=565419 RepID=A0A3D8SHK9_9HELO|nr:hypothetical protein BP5796_03969 [Coleophoma crateriformis]
MSPPSLTEQELQARFEKEYCPPLDTATLLAIIQDYDLTNEAQQVEARQTLDIIKESAAEEEATGFDPSGSSWIQPGPVDDTANGLTEDGSLSARSHPEWASTTDGTSISQGIPAVDLDGVDSSEALRETHGRSDDVYGFDLDGLGDESKESLLLGIFPALKPFDITWTLKKYKGDASAAIDELMNQSFLEESGARHKGIDAFSESELSSKQRKNKGNKGRNRRMEDTSQSSTESPPTNSKWDTGRQDVEFISSKTSMPVEQVSSLYHKNGASLQATISAIIDAHAALNINTEDDAVLQLHAHELGKQFSSISPSDIMTLVQITHPSQGFAQDLAEALAHRPSTTKPGLHLEFRHAPIDLTPEIRSSRWKPQSHNAVHAEGTQTYFDSADASAAASAYRATRNDAFAKASTAWRKGKSDHLMGAAAAYYADLGKEYDVRAKSAESAAADALVATQSSWDLLDLHGVNVKDAIRISRERVTTWWHGLGDARISGRAGSYKIVTGLGIHSKEGKARLGPAVAKMLMREGWKVEVGQGTVLVTGVVRTPATTKK